MKVSGEALRAARTAKNLSQGDLAAKIGVHFTLISKAENGQRDLSLSIVYQIAQVLGVPMEVLLPDQGRDVTVDDVREA